MSWSKSQLVSTCSRLRNHVLSRGLAGEDELLEHWPGTCRCSLKRDATCGSCTSRSKHDWYMVHSQLLRMMGRGEYLSGDTEEADEQLLKQINQEPKTLTLIDGDTLTVYPKGLRALLFVRDRDWLCSWLATNAELIREAVTENRQTIDKPISTLDMIEQEIADQMATILAVATTPGPDFDRRAVETPSEKLKTLAPLDLHRLNRAFFKVNVPHLHLIEFVAGPQKPAEEGGGRMSWSVFYSRAGKAKGVDAQSLMRNQSLASLLIELRLAQPEAA